MASITLTVTMAETFLQNVRHVLLVFQNENDDIGDSVNDPDCLFQPDDFLSSTVQANDTSAPLETPVSPQDVETDTMSFNVENEKESEIDDVTKTGSYEKKIVGTDNACVQRENKRQSKTSCSIVLPKKKKISRAVEEENNVLRVISNSLQEQSKVLHEQAKNSKKSSMVEIKDEDENDTYGKHVANELRSISDPYTRDYIKHEFNKILFSSKWGIRPPQSNSAMFVNGQESNQVQMQSVFPTSNRQQQFHQPESFFNVFDPTGGRNEQVSQGLGQTQRQTQMPSYASAASAAWDQYGNMNEVVPNDSYQLTRL